jgi:hypothetical protein
MMRRLIDGLLDAITLMATSDPDYWLALEELTNAKSAAADRAPVALGAAPQPLVADIDAFLAEARERSRTS